MDDSSSPEKSSLEETSRNPALGIAALAIALHRKSNNVSPLRTMDTSTPSSSSSVVSSSSSSSSNNLATAHANHPFFHYYGLLIHQQNMLQDLVRTGAYHDAIMRNASDFEGKIVVDVGTGSGILAYFAIKAGAKRVYAIEASNVADRAAALIQANGLQDRIIVIKSTVETVDLPEKADIIISEPMGFLLIHERMLESYIIARQRFLKPHGLMFPTTGTIYTTPFTDNTLWTEQANKVHFWNTKDFYGLDLSSLADAAMADHFSQPVVGYIDPSSLLSNSTVNHTIDFSKDEPKSLHHIVINFDFIINRTGVCHGLAAWFDVSFNGSTEQYILNTGPYYPGTHWYQCRLLLREPIAVNSGQKIQGTLDMVANDRYSYNMTLKMKLAGSEATTANHEPIASTVSINLHDQMYHYLNASYGK